MTVALDAGALDIRNDPDEESYEIITSPEDFEPVRGRLREAAIEVSMAEVTMLPKTYVKLEGRKAEQMTHLMESIEDHDDVQNVYANFDIPDEVMAHEGS
jgi:transcriptional/translational regulatory protein YebC/TACO1